MSSRNKKTPSAANNRKRPRALISTPELSSEQRTCDLSVKVTDLLADTVQRVHDLECEVQILRAAHGNSEKLLADLNALTFLMGNVTDPDPKVASTAGAFINSVAAEVANRIRCAKNAIVLNIPDNLPLALAHEQLFMSCGIDFRCGDCIRLRKRSPKYPCPILFRFQNEAQAKTFISSQLHLQKYTRFKSVRILRDRTPLERMCSAKPTHLAERKKQLNKDDVNASMGSDSGKILQLNNSLDSSPVRPRTVSSDISATVDLDVTHSTPQAKKSPISKPATGSSPPTEKITPHVKNHAAPSPVRPANDRRPSPRIPPPSMAQHLSSGGLMNTSRKLPIIPPNQTSRLMTNHAAPPLSAPPPLYHRPENAMSQHPPRFLLPDNANPNVYPYFPLPPHQADFFGSTQPHMKLYHYKPSPLDYNPLPYAAPTWPFSTYPYSGMSTVSHSAGCPGPMFPQLIHQLAPGPR
jgi:hypothetical protein